ncbi:MAG: hypothetical protein ABI680_11105 [Chthoniobacteraceae bacterium]
MILAASLPTFQRLFPNFPEQCKTLYTLLVPVAVVILVVGLIGVMRQANTPRTMLRPIVKTLMVIMAIALWSDWSAAASGAAKTVIEKMDANPSAAAQKYVDILVSKEEPKSKDGWFGLPSAAQMYEAVLWGMLTLIGLVAQFMIWAAYILQQFLLGLSFAFAPLFLSFLALQATGFIGSKYIMGVVGIICWPLGWAAASIGTSNLIDVATEQKLVVLTNVYGLQTILAAAIIGGWIIITTLIAPVIIQGAIATGAQIGSALLGGALTTGAAAVSAGATTAATLGAYGASGGLAFAGGAAASAGNLAGSAMQGGGPPLSGGMIERLAPTIASAGSSSASDDSGGKGDSGSKGSGGSGKSDGGAPAGATGYNSHDAANDGAVAQMVEQSRQQRDATS